jgi:site-specific DNA-methyltransferase (adenine-specific)
VGSIVFNSDCVEGMKQFPDKYFDLAVVDPPYGIIEKSNRKNKAAGAAAPRKIYNQSLWGQKKPEKEYFKELFRVSKNQIIWGGNYFTDELPISRGWIVWDKLNEDSPFADCELAWTNVLTSVRKFTFRWSGMLQGDMKNKETRIHPTQKPVALYNWIFKNYATVGQKLLDTHLGSGSSRIAAEKYGLDFTGFEIEKEYFDKQEQRYRDFISQTTLF